jgi:hypothetical protein
MLQTGSSVLTSSMKCVWRLRQGLACPEHHMIYRLSFVGCSHTYIIYSETNYVFCLKHEGFFNEFFNLHSILQSFQHSRLSIPLS